MSHFEYCFGDLPKEQQEQLKKTLCAMTRVINLELENKPFIVRGEKRFIQLDGPQ